MVMRSSERVVGQAGINRRKLLRTAASGVAMALAAPCIIRDAEAQGTRIVVRDPGGPFTPGFAEAFYQPFKKETGIEVVGVVSAAEPTAEIKSMVETKSYTWNIAGGMSQTAIQLLADAGYIEKHELDNDPAVSEIPLEYRDAYGIGSDVYSTAIGYRTDKVKKPPQTWKEYWDVANFPGRRALRKYPFDAVEQALMADGVPADKVYPCDLDRAFKSLTAIRPHIDAWWSSGAQATQMLANGEVDMLPVWANRIYAVRDAGVPVEVEWNQNIWGVDVWAILKGTPNADICRKFIKFTCDPKRQATFTKYLTNGPTNPAAYDYIDKKVARTLTTFPEWRKLGLKIDGDYWAKSKDAALDRFNAWLLG
jgi:putative spermidine/putrescine transport system substrate-binding protein